MSPSPMAAAHVLARLRLAAAASRAARAAWRGIDRDAPGLSWVAALNPVVAAVAGAQLAAARGTEPWLLALLGEDPDRPESDQLVPESLAGVTGDGVPLAQALQIPVFTALRLVTQGVPIVQALARGQLLLDLMVRTAVADAGRAADQVGMTTRPAVTSYIRVVESGACSRCIVLAGREYGVSSGFLRHPRCHCGMEPVTRAHRPTAQDPRKVVDAMSAKEKRRVFGQAGAKAIADGADLGQVVNARRGMATATAFGRRLQTTTEGTTRRGVAGRRAQGFQRLPGQRYERSRSLRLMPEEIFRQADDRAHATRLLRLHGYLY
ncbi:hypothetical protein [Streptomyces sp. ADI98-10]|uniref:hypothetical protein n=1 Tax=Streptomyces sp. ADI98-10 TaxID=1522763 RepID=UPI000FB0FF39|nr:hypothetical protein [Streptomyces sp. ADI98-10]RPK85071.1 hypothetical protein EES46_23295 [Streptomyces sp. ADI98-10]